MGNDTPHKNAIKVNNVFWVKYVSLVTTIIVDSSMDTEKKESDAIIIRRKKETVIGIFAPNNVPNIITTRNSKHERRNCSRYAPMK